MALTLSMRVGHDLFIGSTRFVLSKADNPFHFVLRRDDDRLFDVTDQRWTYVRRGVRVQAGTPRNPTAKIVSVVIDAPRTIDIVRGSVKRRPQCPTCHGSKELHQRAPCPSCAGHGCSSCGSSGFINDTFKCPDCVR